MRSCVEQCFVAGAPIEANQFTVQVKAVLDCYCWLLSRSGERVHFFYAFFLVAKSKHAISVSTSAPFDRNAKGIKVHCYVFWHWDIDRWQPAIPVCIIIFQASRACIILNPGIFYTGYKPTFFFKIEKKSFFFQIPILKFFFPPPPPPPPPQRS